MCFSAGASFGASVALSVIGVAAIKKAKTSDQIPFAVIPFIFAVQQFSEGFVWLALSNPAFAFLGKVSSYTFLVFAQIVWPLLVPISITMLEKDVKRKIILRIFIGIGALVSSYFTHRLLMYGVHANIAGHHVAYKQVFPDSLAHIADILYGLATIAPIFLSKVKRMWTFGVAVSIAYIITAVFYVHYILSVWCFFAAIISILIYMIVCGIATADRKTIPAKVHF
jgi:hypothetical protein